MDYLTLTWSVEKGLDLGPVTLRWYSLLFAVGFIIGYRIMKKFMEQENIDQKFLDLMLTYSVIATVIGARLGHVFFYQWDYYSQNPGEILMVWKGGLASHGAAIALIIAMYFLGRRLSIYFVGKWKVWNASLWALDRLVITVALAGCFIRLGNWMNSEIYGRIENSSVETVFARNILDDATEVYGAFFSEATLTPTGEIYETDSVNYPVYTLNVVPQPNISESDAQSMLKGLLVNFNRQSLEKRNAISLADRAPVLNTDGSMSVEILGIPRLPTQLFESLGYLVIFLILFGLFRTKRYRFRNGFTFGMFLVLIFGFRFVIEFWKADQTEFESELTFNMGQYLSIPLVIIGLLFILFSKNFRPQTKDKE